MFSFGLVILFLELPIFVKQVHGFFILALEADTDFFVFDFELSHLIFQRDNQSAQLIIGKVFPLHELDVLVEVHR